MSYQLACSFSVFDKACQGDTQALDILIRFCGLALHRAISRLLRNVSALENDDIAQETWLLLLKDHCRVLRQYDFDKGDFGSFLFGVATRVVRNHRRRNACRSPREKSMTYPSTEFPICDALLHEVIEDLSTEASVAENRFLQQSLLRAHEQNASYSKVNSRQLTHRLFEKVWPLVYGPDVPLSPRNNKPRRSPGRAKSKRTN